MVVNHIYSPSPIEIRLYKIMAEVLGQEGETEELLHIYFSFMKRCMCILNYTSVFFDLCILIHASFCP